MHPSRGNPKLTPEQVAELRMFRRFSTLTLKELGKRYGVSHVAIWKIANGHTWKNA